MSEKKEKNDKKPKDNKETSDKKQSTKSGNSKDPLTIKEKVSLLTSDSSIEYAFARGGGASLWNQRTHRVLGYPDHLQRRVLQMTYP